MPKLITAAPELRDLAAELLADDGPLAYLRAATLLWGWTTFVGHDAELDDAEKLAAWTARQKPVTVSRVNATDVVLLGHMDQDQPVFRILVPHSFWERLTDSQQLAVLHYALAQIEMDNQGAWRVNRDAYRLLRILVWRQRDLSWMEHWETFVSACASLAREEPQLDLFAEPEAASVAE